MKNKEGRKLLEEKYGEGCFMERAGIRKITPAQEQKMKRTIKGFKKLDRTISYHHIKERKDGGKVTIENGANLAAYNHAWLHQQSPEVKAEINRKLQEFKMSIDIAEISCEDKVASKNSQHIEFDLTEYTSIKAYDNTEKDEERRRRKFERAKKKRETMRMVEDELYEM